MKRLAAVVATVAVLTAGCGLDAAYKLPFEVGPGSIKPVPELSGVTVRVGSKNFTEQILLGYIAQVALSAAGADVEDLTNIQGSPSVRQALEVGDVDVYWEYIGTSWINFQQQTKPIPDEQAQYDAVKKADEERFDITWLDYSPVNDKYALATTREFASRHRLRTMSDMVALLRKDPSLGSFCLESDGRILTLDLTVLEDDKKTFPQYNAAVTMREEFLAAHPQLADVLNPVAARLNNDTILELSVKIDGEGQDPAVVARDWLVEEGFVTSASKS